jgi:hypothetical protein
MKTAKISRKEKVLAQLCRENGIDGFGLTKAEVLDMLRGVAGYQNKVLRREIAALFDLRNIN